MGPRDFGAGPQDFGAAPREFSAGLRGLGAGLRGFYGDEGVLAELGNDASRSGCELRRRRRFPWHGGFEVEAVKTP